MNRKLLSRPGKLESSPADASSQRCPETTGSPSRAPELPPRIELTDIAIPILVLHAIALFAFVPGFITGPNVILFGVTVVVFSQGITLGYHRLLAHGSLRVPKWLEYFYVGLALCSLQESPAKWVSTHRRHHVHSDDTDDPHSPQRSFLWSHIGWLLFRRKGKSEFAVDDRYSADIICDPIYAALERHPALPGLLYLIQCLVFWVLATAIYLVSAEDMPTAAWSGLGTMLWGVVLRTVTIWHLTWSVNSLTHRFGYQNYNTADDSRNNWLVALFSNGEGWHNNHHHDAASASNQHRWWEWDLTYYHICLLEKLGLATHVVRPRHIRQSQTQTRQQDSG